MIVKDIIKTAAMLLGRDKVAEYLSAEDVENRSVGDDVLKSVNLFTQSVNLTVSELAETYFPAFKTEAVDGREKIFFSSLSERAVSVKEVRDISGDTADFKIYPEYVFVKGGAGEITYRYLPANLGLTDRIEFSCGEVTPRMIAYGTAAEFCLAELSFETALVWREKFMKAVESKCLPKSVKIKTRRFA